MQMNFDYAPFYEHITKPFFAPPGWVFGLAWGIIYPLIAISLVYCWYLVWKKRMPHKVLWVFFLNMAANLTFTPVQLGLSSLWPATIVILIVLATLIYLERSFWRISKINFFLVLPYLLWGIFATILQLSIVFLN